MSVPGNPIIALHGNLGSPDDWDSLSLPGIHAIRLWDYTSLSFSDFAREIATTISHGMERPLLAGYSMGGRLALHAMAFYPERWGGAVILSAHPGLSGVEEKHARRVSDKVWAQRAREMEWGEFLEKWNGQGVLGGGEETLEMKQAQVALESRREAIALAFETWSLARQEDMRHCIGSFRAPVLWITGEHDDKFTALGEEMAGVFPDFRHEVIPGCGHRVLAEKPGEVAMMIRLFFEADYQDLYSASPTS